MSKTVDEMLEEYPEPPGTKTLSRHMEVFDNEDAGRKRADEFVQKVKALDFSKVRAGVLITVEDVPGEDPNSLGQMLTMTFGPAHITMHMAANLAHIAMQLQQAEEAREKDPEIKGFHQDARH